MNHAPHRNAAVARFGLQPANSAIAFAITFVFAAALCHGLTTRTWADDAPSPPKTGPPPKTEPCEILADKRLELPIGVIAKEYSRRTGVHVRVEVLSAAEVNKRVAGNNAAWDVVLCMPEKDDKDEKPAVASLPGAKKVAWKYPGGAPVWAAATSKHPAAAGLLQFIGGPTGHRLWSESPAGFTITTGKTHAEAFAWVVENRVGHTYPMTAMRMLRECGNVRDGICIDVGCGTGNLDVELARRSNLKIIGLDIDPDMRPLFEKRIREAGLADRVRFVVGDAQKMPFPDDHADVIVSRGTLVFIPDLAKCLREVDRVLKPTGVAFLGGRYVYTPQVHKMSTAKLQEIVTASGVKNAQVIDARGQWVKIVGPDAPKAAREPQAGPHLLANRFIADYGITEGECLLICRSDGGLEQALQQGFMDGTDLQITAVYSTDEHTKKAQSRLREAKLDDCITCKTGDIHALPFETSSFDLIAGVGPILIWGDREKAMRELYRVLRPGGAALVGGRYLHMPDFRKVSSQTLRDSAAKTGIQSIRVIDDMGQWVEVRKGIQNRGVRD